MIDKIVSLFEESVIIQGLISVPVVWVWLYMVAVARPIPSSLDNLVGLVVGFFLGGKFVQALAKKNGGA